MLALGFCWVYQFRPDGVLVSTGCCSRRMRMPGRNGRLLGYTSLLYLSSSPEAMIASSSCWKGYLKLPFSNCGVCMGLFSSSRNSVVVHVCSLIALSVSLSSPLHFGQVALGGSLAVGAPGSHFPFWPAPEAPLSGRWLGPRVAEVGHWGRSLGSLSASLHVSVRVGSIHGDPRPTAVLKVQDC